MKAHRLSLWADEDNELDEIRPNTRQLVKPTSKSILHASRKWDGDYEVVICVFACFKAWVILACFVCVCLPFDPFR